MMEWHWPQWTIAVLLGLSVLGGIIFDGEPRAGRHNGALTAIMMAAEAWILHMGGFW